MRLYLTLFAGDRVQPSGLSLEVYDPKTGKPATAPSKLLVQTARLELLLAAFESIGYSVTIAEKPFTTSVVTPKEGYIDIGKDGV